MMSDYRKFPTGLLWYVGSFFLLQCDLWGAVQRHDAAEGETDRPSNVVLIISDDQAWTDYGFMGHGQIRTPRLDQLARGSLVYPRGYVPSSLCCPSLASIITSQYLHQNKITSNDPMWPAGLSLRAALDDPEFQAR